MNAEAIALERGLPSNPFVERMVLGAILIRGERFAEFADALAAVEFSLDKHQRIWMRMTDLYHAGRPIGRVSLAEELTRHGELEACDGLSYLASLDEGLPEILDLENYIRIVKENATARRVVFQMQNLISEILQRPGEIPDLIARADVELANLAGELVREKEFHSAADVFESAGGLDSYLTRRQMPGVPFPWPKLTYWTGGLQGGDLCIVAADTGRGKTTLALNCAIYAARKTGLSVPVVSLEMSRQQCTDKMLAAVGKFDSYELRRVPDAATRQKIMRAATEAEELPILFRDRATSIGALPSVLRRLRAKREIAVVIVDYLQLMESDGRTRADQVARVARGLKNIAMDLGVPIMALSQFRRPESRNGGGRQLSDLKESSEIEQAANLVLFLESKGEHDADPTAVIPVEIIIAKQRMGVANFCVELLWRKDWGVFWERGAAGGSDE